ncbi:peptidyl-prolyl cis-trans isomerase [Lutibacter holmesii]|uniref:Peptidyl-prolyl cis-trans isomerase n=1 Tax=Lutibacter holmesii TaxID=1137985 RepID=A0ABW3WRD8_9FLAO
MRNVSYIFILLILNSCNYFTIKNDTREVVARVGDTFLYKEDLSGITASSTSSQDSLLISNNYINNWIKQQLLLSKAQINLENEIDKFEDLVKKYREDLYINSYKEAVVKEYLNTEISNEDIEQFYEGNKQNFKLNEELLKLKFIKLGKDVYEKKEIIKLFKSKKKEDLDKLVSKEMSLKLNHLNDSVWIKYSDLVTKIPILKTIDKTDLLKKGNFIQKEDSLSLYLVAVNAVLNRNEVAPISYISPTIKQMILHQRKLLLIRNIEETLIDDASKKQQFEIY